MPVTYAAITKNDKCSGLKKMQTRDFPGDPVVKSSPSNARRVGSIPGQEDHTCLTASKPKYKTEAIL